MSLGTANGSSAKKLNGASSKSPAVELTDEIVKQSGGKPDVNHHHAQLDAIKAEIEKVTSDLDNVKASLSGSIPSNTPEGKRRAELHSELDTIRQSQAGSKGARGKILDDLKSRQDNLSTKIKALQTSKAKSAYKSPQEIDAAIARLDTQIESGQMKLVDEKRALSEISNLRKSRKAVEAFSQQQKTIDTEREEVDKLRAQLDDPQSRALSKRFDEIKTELDALKAKTEKSGESRQQLMTKRGELQTHLDSLWQRRRARQAAFRSENDNFQTKIRQEREKRNAQYKEEKRAEEARRRKEEEKTLREDAALPAYAKEIEDCDVLIRYFSNNAEGAQENETSEEAKKALEGVKPLELRTVDTDAFAGATIAKKKGEDDDEGYFIGSAKKSKAKGKKKSRGTPLSLGNDNASAEEQQVESGKLNVPLSTLSALLSLNIPPPTNSNDIVRVVENLQRKKAFFIGDQKRKTQENIERVEKKLQALNVDDGSVDVSKDEKAMPALTENVGSPINATKASTTEVA